MTANEDDQGDALRCRHCPASIRRLPSGVYVDRDGFGVCQKKQRIGDPFLTHEPMPVVA